jgi:hypothetical protein
MSPTSIGICPTGNRQSGIYAGLKLKNAPSQANYPAEYNVHVALLRGIHDYRLSLALYMRYQYRTKSNLLSKQILYPLDFLFPVPGFQCNGAFA